MPSVKELKAAAKAAGHTGYSKFNKAKLEALLAGGEPAAAATEGPGLPEGVPTEPEKANLTETEKDGIALVAGRPTRLAFDGAGIPTEPERGGVTEKDLNVAGAFGDAAKGKAGKKPSHTGQTDGIGVPTEAKRGGVNTLERKLAEG